MLKIITNPHPTLRKKAEEVPKKEITKLGGFIDDMVKTMHEANGIGLAAPQVDVSKRIIVISTKDGPLALINPELSKKSFRKEEAEEGCLSVPGAFGFVKRHFKVVAKGYDREGKRITVKAERLFARVLQHEVDHINGVLFVDRAKKVTTGNESDATQKI